MYNPNFYKNIRFVMFERKDLQSSAFWAGKMEKRKSAQLSEIDNLMSQTFKKPLNKKGINRNNVIDGTYALNKINTNKIRKVSMNITYDVNKLNEIT
jgi:hypothetical protein